MHVPLRHLSPRSLRSFLRTFYAYCQTLPVIGGVLSKRTACVFAVRYLLCCAVGNSTGLHKVVDYLADDKKKNKTEV